LNENERMAHLWSEVFHRYAGVFEVVTDRGPEFSSLFSALCKSWGAKHILIAAKNPQANGQVERYMQVIKAALRKCANEHPTEWHMYVSGICSDIRNNVQVSTGMSPYKALFGREPILPVELRFPTLTTLIEPDLDMEETAEHRQSRIDQMERAQSICKAHILGAQVVQKKNYARWNRKRKRKTDSLVKDDWVLMKKPGTIVGSRLRWEGPYLFRGWKDPQSKRKAVIQDASGRKWHRVSSQLRKYYPRLDFARVYLQAIKEVDDRVPSAAEISAQFVQAPFNTSSFVTLRIAERIAKMRKTVGFLPLGNTPRFL
jgi:hypothetical protein